MNEKLKKLKVIFMGTPTFAVPVLEELIKNTNVILIVSQPDREKDRKGNIIPTPIKRIAIENNIETFSPEKIKDNYQEIIDKNPDIIITCAYGQIIPKSLLDYPKYGCINVHGSLLPKYRGGAPIHRAIMNGEKETGITIMYMDSKMDAGDIISQEKITILPEYNLDILYNKMSILGSKLLIKTLPDIIEGKISPIKQDENQVTYGYNIKKEEEQIDFNDLAINIHNKIRSLSTLPAAFCYLDNKRMKVYESEVTNIKVKDKAGKIINIDKNGIYINAIDYVIIFKDIKLEGKNRCLVKDFINGIDYKSLIGKSLN